MGILDKFNLNRKEENIIKTTPDSAAETASVKELPALEILMQGIRIERMLEEKQKKPEEKHVQPVVKQEAPALKKNENGMSAVLVSADGQRYEAVGPVCILGRSDEADISINNPDMDELQAVILWKNGVCYVANDFSAKTVKVNGMAVERGKRLPLDNGGRLEFPGGLVLTREQ